LYYSLLQYRTAHAPEIPAGAGNERFHNLQITQSTNQIINKYSLSAGIHLFLLTCILLAGFRLHRNVVWQRNINFPASGSKVCMLIKPRNQTQHKQKKQ
jgi:hypothetical protein